LTYTIEEKENEAIVKNPSGDQIETLERPYRVPADIIQAILNDIGGNPGMKQAMKVIATKDWEVNR